MQRREDARFSTQGTRRPSGPLKEKAGGVVGAWGGVAGAAIFTCVAGPSEGGEGPVGIVGMTSRASPS